MSIYNKITDLLSIYKRLGLHKHFILHFIVF